MGFKNFGGVALFWFHPLGGLPSPIWPSQILALGTLTKIVFVRGRSPPIWGRYEFWSVCTLAHFFSKSARQILDFLSRSLVSTACYRFREFKQNRWSTIRANFAQSWEKKAKSHFLGCERRKYSKSRGRYNGLMLKFSPGGAVTVRDTPHKVYEVE